jgi:CheY-like chemotaxis protein
MESFENFRQHLQNALMYLHNPNYSVPEELRNILSLSTEDGLPEFQSTLMKAIESLRPGLNMPSGSRAEYIYEVLRQRFVMGLTQEKVAERLDLSLRSLQRLQHEATHVLARALWELRQVDLPAMGQLETELQTGWSSQLQQELLLLQAQSPDAECQLAEALAGAARIFQVKSGKRIPIIFPEDNREAKVRFHPTVLRQIVVSLLDTISRSMPDGQIRLEINAGHKEIVLSITAVPAPAVSPDLSLAQELLSMQKGAIQTSHEQELMKIDVHLPLQKTHQAELTVLVVDDNRDLVNLYQSYCASSNYKIEAINEGKGIFDAVERTKPAIILLDILLPDVDGWDLLLELHVNPLTKDIPIIVCSVVTDEQLVLDLGAALYLRKPVWRQQLLAGFEKALQFGKTGRI